MERESFTPVPKNLQFRVGLLLGLTLMVAAGFILYALYARGVFEATQKLTLVADNAEGVSLGMDLTFSGFPIGRVERISLADDGRARIEIEVPTQGREVAAHARASSRSSAASSAARASGPSPATCRTRRCRTAPSARCCAATRRRRFRAWWRPCAASSRTSSSSRARRARCRRAWRRCARSPSAWGARARSARSSATSRMRRNSSR